MKAWDARETADSAAAALYEVWIAKHLGPAFVQALAPKAGDIIGNEAALGTIVDASEAPTKWFKGDDAAKAGDAALLIMLVPEDVGQGFRDELGR